MKRQASWADRLLKRMELEDESMPKQCILELCNDSRVLIENHMGVIEYGTERVCVKVQYGQITVIGNDLHMKRMIGQILVICGRIKQIDVKRRCH